jgi:hypothetical protein
LRFTAGSSEWASGAPSINDASDVVAETPNDGEFLWFVEQDDLGNSVNNWQNVTLRPSHIKALTPNGSTIPNGNYIIQVSGSGQIALADIPDTGTDYTLPLATANALGGVKVSPTIAMDGVDHPTFISLQSDTLVVDTSQFVTLISEPNSGNDTGKVVTYGSVGFELQSIPTSPTYTAGAGISIDAEVLSLTAATDSVLGGIQIGSGLAIDGSGVVSVSFPSDANTTYTTDSPYLSVTAPAEGSSTGNISLVVNPLDNSPAISLHGHGTHVPSFSETENGKHLVVENGALAWATESTGSSDLNGLTDVTAASPSDGEILTYRDVDSNGNAAGWYAETPVSASSITYRGTKYIDVVNVPRTSNYPYADLAVNPDQGVPTVTPAFVVTTDLIKEASEIIFRLPPKPTAGWPDDGFPVFTVALPRLIVPTGSEDSDPNSGVTNIPTNGWKTEVNRLSDFVFEDCFENVTAGHGFTLKLSFLYPDGYSVSSDTPDGRDVLLIGSALPGTNGWVGDGLIAADGYDLGLESGQGNLSQNPIGQFAGKRHWFQMYGGTPAAFLKLKVIMAPNGVLEWTFEGAHGITPVTR